MLIVSPPFPFISAGKSVALTVALSHHVGKLLIFIKRDIDILPLLHALCYAVPELLAAGLAGVGSLFRRLGAW